MRGKATKNKIDDLDASKLGDTGFDSTVADVELDESLDDTLNPDALEDTAAGARSPSPGDDALDIDPERGTVRVADKTSVRGVLASDEGLFVLGLIAALLGLSVAIYASIHRTMPALIAAGVLCPPAFVWAYLKWKRWIAGSPYVYRVLLSLNEKEAAKEALTEHEKRQETRIQQKIAKAEDELRKSSSA